MHALVCERDGVCVCVRACVCVRKRESVRMRVCVRERERVCMREREREGESLPEGGAVGGAGGTLRPAAAGHVFQVSGNVF